MAKKMKKLLALVLTAAMVMSFMSVGAFAAEGEGSEGAETEPATYTVTYAYDETAPEGAVVPVDENEYEEGETVELVEPEAVDGYTFNGWDVEGNFTMPAEDVTITGSWTEVIPVAKALDLTAVAEASGEGWTWADDTLTLNGATIDSSNDDVPAPAIKLPDGATIVVNGVNIIHASDDQNGIICDGALTIQGNGTLNVSCNYGIYANTVSIEDIALNIDAAVIGIYAYNKAGDASVELTNVSGTIVGGSYAGIFVDCEYSGANSSCVLDGCDLTVISNATRTDMRCRRSGIAVYSGIASVVCTMEIKDSIVDATGYDAGLGMNSYANGAATATMLIENSTVNATATSNGWAGIFASTIGKTEDDVCIITIKNSDVAAQGVGIGIMTSASCGVSEVNVDDSSVMVSGETAGIRVRNNGSGAKTATFTNNALLVVAGQPANVIDEGIYTLDDTSKIVTATEGSITANGDGTFAIAKGSEVTAEYAAEPVAYTFYMQAGGIGGNGYAEREIWGYDTSACQIVETGEEYLTLTEAVADANALDKATIKMLKSIDFDSTKALAITGNVTIIGEHTISRGDYTGTMFSVAKNATLTLDGGVILDGNNNWTFDSANYYADMAAGKTLSTGAKNSYTTSNGIVATAEMFSVQGAVIMSEATIQNNWGSTLFDIPSASASLTMNKGALIKHIHGFVVSKGSGSGLKGTWTMNDGKIDDVYGHNANGALVDIRGGTFTINGGEITNVRTLGLKSNGNGILAQVFGESSKLNINGGDIYGNASFSPGNGWGSVVYLNRGGDFTMTGGTIKATKSDKCTAFVSNTPTSVELLGGTIEVDPSKAAWFDSQFYGNVTVAEGMEIVGTEDAFFCMLGYTQYTLDIDGQISGGTIWLMHNVPVTGNGTITSDVLVKADPNYFGFDGKVTVTESTKWLNSLITVDSVGSDAFLTVDSGVVIDGVQVRVLGSVASGEYTNAGESAAEQAAAYIEQTGATVESPVLFYHRLTSDQKSDIVVTFDYNGGLDAQNWSGCQITSAEAFAPTCPEPTKDGYVLIGWKYAVDKDPESLSMAGTADYAGETIAQSVRLIAQWGRECTVTYVGYYGNEMQTLTAKTGDAVPEYSSWMVPARFPDGNYYYTFSGWNLTEGTLSADGKVGITDLVYTAIFDAHAIEDIFTPFFPTGDDDDTGSNETVIDDEQVPLAGVPAAFREDHIAYIIGRDDGLVHPEDNITRAEVAMIFYRLLNDETRELYTTTESYFPDVTENDWYCAAVSTLNAMGIIYGKPDGTFAPNAYITRAEFAAIAARFDPTASTEGGFFTDIAGHWAELEINMAANNGWVEGYNGLFRPDENITRAEAMTMVNRVLLRVPESMEDLLDGMIVWADNMDPSKWYYLAVQEATNSHDYARKESGYEYWIALTNEEK